MILIVTNANVTQSVEILLTFLIGQSILSSKINKIYIIFIC